MFEVRQTTEFEEWLEGLADIRAQRRIADRIIRVKGGLLGDAKLFEGVGELRVDYGPGYRLYFVRRGSSIIILPCGGHKSTQKRDIKKAIELTKEV